MAKMDFLSKNNMATLWEVISDEDIFKKQNTSNKNSILKLFSDHITNFYNTESKNPNANIMEMNKKYILLLLNFIKTNYSSGPSKIVIHAEEPNTELSLSITSEERKKDRMTQMEKEFMELEEDFKNAVSIPIPKTPDFSDNIKEKPITEMERAIKEMAEQRKYDIERINKNYNTNDQEWLQPVQTSLKPVLSNSSNSSNNRINSDNNINSNRKVRHIKWEDEKESNIQLLLEEEQDIFSKLKPIHNPSDKSNTNTRISTLEDTVKQMQTQMATMGQQLSEIVLLLKKE